MSKILCPKIRSDEDIFNDLKIHSHEYENLEEILGNLHQEMAKSRTFFNSNSIRYPRINFLGTGSSVSTYTRNVSSILVNLSPETNILLDCGEGTLSQISILFGQQKYEEELMKIKYIFVSHYHSDHHLGILNILFERNKCFERRNMQPSKVYLSLPNNLIDFIKKWCNFVDSKLFQNNVQILHNEWFIPQFFNTRDYNYLRKKRFQRNEQANDELCKYLNLTSIDIVPVLHVLDSSGIVFTTNEENPFKLVFSGDCRPSDALINYGQNCDLLIHEGTFAEVFEDDAVKKKHSTIKEAIQVGSQMNAKHLFLWHFSQRYCKIPDMSGINMMDKLSCSFDFMVVDRNELDLTPKFNNIYNMLFSEAHDDIENKKRNKKAKMIE
jgi:ribonuclease Z